MPLLGVLGGGRGRDPARCGESAARSSVPLCVPLLEVASGAFVASAATVVTNTSARNLARGAAPAAASPPAPVPATAAEGFECLAGWDEAPPLKSSTSSSVSAGGCGASQGAVRGDWALRLLAEEGRETTTCSAEGVPGPMRDAMLTVSSLSSLSSSSPTAAHDDAAGHCCPLRGVSAAEAATRDATLRGAPTGRGILDGSADQVASILYGVRVYRPSASSATTPAAMAPFIAPSRGRGRLAAAAA